MQHVLVVGGGPVGFLTALGLAQRGLRVTLVEAEPDIVNSPRAAVYHWYVLEGLKQLGILDEALETGFAKQDYCHFVFRTNERIHWSLAPLAEVAPYPFNLHLGQNDLARIACRHLERFASAEVRFATRLTDLTQDASGVTARLSGPGGETVERFDWLIGADGGGSTVREKSLKLNFFGITHPERFIATNVRLPFESFGYARANMVMDDVHGAIIAKLDKSDLWRVTFMEDASQPLDTVTERIDAFYRAYAPGVEEYELVQYSPYRMHQRCADTMRVGRVILAGDAAHITNPTGGLGLTSGLLDLYFLLDILNAIVNEGASPDLLDRYSDERRRIFLEIASPRAVQNKQMIFHAHAGRLLDTQVQAVRRLATDPDAVRAQVPFARSMQSSL
ncbi:FAD-dependent oxidoreductase [Pararhodobacter sp.]|uniref:FAD-dependent oxidoreductase n=1 Tax=Pararhodobacter sp. TaxID=2127056 RepID=UPI002AFE8F6D|nr:FAD-dependent oxidoreductase [Pararhodobacter sp.]